MEWTCFLCLEATNVLPWFSPGSAAGDDVGSQKEGWQAFPPGLVLPPWRPWNTQRKKKSNANNCRRMVSA